MSVSKEKLPTLKLLIQGEPTFDVSVTDCPGDIGVLCKQIERITNKDKKVKEQITAEKEVQTAHKEVATTVAPVNGLIDITQIVIPKYFEDRQPEPEKVEKAKRYLQKLGKVKKTFSTIQKNALWSGYVWYTAALELGVRKIPVEYKDKLIDIHQIVIPEQFEKVRLNPSNLEKKEKIHTAIGEIGQTYIAFQ